MRRTGPVLGGSVVGGSVVGGSVVGGCVVGGCVVGGCVVGGCVVGGCVVGGCVVGGCVVGGCVVGGCDVGGPVVVGDGPRRGRSSPIHARTATTPAANSIPTGVVHVRVDWTAGATHDSIPVVPEWAKLVPNGLRSTA